MEADFHTSLLVDPERHPLLASDFIRQLGSVAVIAPHPDDESLGCGGLLALLARAGQPAHVIVMTDGSRSHPGSKTHPAGQLATLREEELLAALAALGWPATAAHFLRFGDCALPAQGTTEFDEASSRLCGLLAALAPATILSPWRRDPHCDHEATWSLLRAAAARLAPRPCWLEYPVWAWTQAEGEAAPRAHEASAWRLDISPVLGRKEEAIRQHRSQLGAVIRDDPSGFVLEPSMLAHFSRPWELFLEPADG